MRCPLSPWKKQGLAGEKSLPPPPVCIHPEGFVVLYKIPGRGLIPFEQRYKILKNTCVEAHDGVKFPQE